MKCANIYFNTAELQSSHWSNKSDINHNGEISNIPR